MRFIVSSSLLLKNIQTLSGVLNSNNTLDIINCFLFEIEKNKLIISASDLQNTMKSEIEIRSEHTGSIAISAKLLLEILKTFAEQPLTFIVNENNTLEIHSSQGKYNFAYFNGEDFPRPIEMDSLGKFSIKGDVLASAIDKTLFAVSNDELRPNINGVLFSLKKNQFIFVGTDSHKLTKYSRAFESETESDMIVPKKSLGLLKNIVSGSEEDVNVNYNEANVVFTFGNMWLTCRLIDGKFPNYEVVIPKDNPNKLIINRELFLNTLRRVSIFSSKDTYQTRFKIAGSDLHILTEDTDYNNKAEERLICNYSGDDIEIGFSSKLLIEMISHLESEEVMIEMSLPNKAGIISPSDGTEEGEHILMLAMPSVLPN